MTLLNVNIIFKRTIDLDPIHVDQYIVLCALYQLRQLVQPKPPLDNLIKTKKGNNTMDLAILKLVKQEQSKQIHYQLDQMHLH